MVWIHSPGTLGCVSASCLAGGLGRERAKCSNWVVRESCHVEREGRSDWGAGGHVGGVPPRVRVSAPSSDFVAPFLIFSQAKCLKEMPRASRVLREVPAPSSLGDGGLSGGGRRLHSLQVAFPPSAPGTSPSEESRRYRMAPF